MCMCFLWISNLFTAYMISFSELPASNQLSFRTFRLYLGKHRTTSQMDNKFTSAKSELDRVNNKTSFQTSRKLKITEWILLLHRLTKKKIYRVFQRKSCDTRICNVRIKHTSCHVTSCLSTHGWESKWDIRDIKYIEIQSAIDSIDIYRLQMHLNSTLSNGCNARNAKDCHWPLAAWAPHKSPSPHSRPLSWTDLSQSDSAQWLSQNEKYRKGNGGSHGKTIFQTGESISIGGPTWGWEKEPPQFVPGWKWMRQGEEKATVAIVLKTYCLQCLRQGRLFSPVSSPHQLTGKAVVTGFDPVHNLIESSEANMKYISHLVFQVRTSSGESEVNRPQMNEDRRLQCT